MSFGDLEYGWHGLTLELRDIRLGSGAEVVQLNSDSGKWESRDYPVFGDKESVAAKLETDAEFNTQPIARWLSARAGTRDLDSLFLGVPADRQRASLSQEGVTRIDSVHLIISESETARPLRAGRVRYLQAGETWGSDVHAQVYCGCAAFEELNKAALGAAPEVSVELLLRGWHWLGPIGDQHTYVSVDEKYEPAELSKITCIRRVPDRVLQPDDADEPPESLETVVGSMRQRMIETEKLMASMRVSLWVLVALAAAWLATTLL